MANSTHTRTASPLLLALIAGWLCASPVAAQESSSESTQDREPETLDEMARQNARTGRQSTSPATRRAGRPQKGLDWKVETIHREVIPIYIKPGRREGVRLNQIFLVYDVGPNNEKILIGKAWVAIVGPGYVTAGEGSSRADTQQTLLLVYEWTSRPTRGTMLEETGDFYDTRQIRR